MKEVKVLCRANVAGKCIKLVQMEFGCGLTAYRIIEGRSRMDGTPDYGTDYRAAHAFGDIIASRVLDMIEDCEL